MTLPAILAVDDDHAVLSAVPADLRGRYAERYRILAASSGEEALALDVPGAEGLTNAGISYAAGHAEALDHRGGQVLVVWGGNSAGQGALYLSFFAEQVTMLVRDATLATTMSHVMADGDVGSLPPGWNAARNPFPLETNVPGVFVAGDARAGSIKRVASSVGEGAMAVRFVHEHLASL